MGSLGLAGTTRAEVRFDRVSLEEGLSQAQVYSILQDTRGFMWFATQDGLNLYDGYTFTIYKADQDNPTGLSNNNVRSLLQDRLGSLWIGTDGGGLNRLQLGEEAFEHFKHNPEDQRTLSHNRVRAILEDRKGVLWVGTDGGGLDRLNRDTASFFHYAHDPDDPTSLSDNHLRAIHEDREGALWVGTVAGGLNRLERTTGAFVHFRHDAHDPTTLSHDHVRAIYEDKDGDLWVGTEGGGLNRFDRSTGTFIRYRNDPEVPGSLSSDVVFAIFQDRDDTLWVGTDGGGLNEWRPSSDKFHHFRNEPTDSTSLSSDGVLSIYQDQGGVLWVGTKLGLSKWNPTTAMFPHVRQKPDDPSGPSGQNVWAFYEDPRTTDLWIGTFDGGLNRWDRRADSYAHYRHDPEDARSLSSDRVTSLQIDRRGILWVGTFRSGLNRLNPATGKFRHYRHDPADPTSLSADGVPTVYEDRLGDLWVSGWRAGINRYDPTTDAFERYAYEPSNPDGLSSGRVTVIGDDRSGGLWVGTDGGGLNRLERGKRTFTHYRHDPQDPASLSHDSIFSILEDHQGVLWIGTQGGGLNRMNCPTSTDSDCAFQHYTESDGLPSNSVLAIQQDEDGHLWLSTNQGISKFDPRSQTFKNYDESHGLLREFGFGASYRSQRGEMFFGGPSGYNAFYPDKIRDNPHPPPVALTGIQVLDRKHDPTTEQLELGYRDYVVTFQFAALDYTAPAKNQYKFKLEGLDDDWRDPVPATSREATYTNLPPRNSYVFRVKASNNDGVWNEQGTALRISVRPAPWKSRWAYTLYTLLGVGLVLSYARNQAKKLQREAVYSHKLEEEVQARTRELAKRNEELQLVNQRLEEASLTDSLTGLRNRRFVMGYMHRETASNRRQNSDGSTAKTDFLFLMIDLDGLKEINDTYGHLAGDRMLIQVRRILESACRDSDIISRWGGDEFLIVGRNVQRFAAEKLAERIRREVEETPFDLGVGRTVELSCSIGVAFYPFIPMKPELVSWEQVVAIADRALYAAKKSGRNAWVGILSTEEMEKTRPGELVKLINERLETLVQTGGIELLSSIPSPQSRLAL